MNLKFESIVRGFDRFGSGIWGASRGGGTRTHNGIDYACKAGSTLLSPVSGVVTKLGYAYSDDLSFRYIQVEDTFGYNHRFFYIKPSVSLHTEVLVGFKLGIVQTLQGRYEGITDHVHYGIKGYDGEYINPDDYYGSSADV